MNEIKVLACIYKILAESNKDILENLNKSKNQPREILAVIQALKNAKIALDAQEKGNRASKKPIILKQTIYSQLSWNPQSKRLWKSITNAFEDKKTYNLTNKSFIQAFTNSGLQTNARVKDGKQFVLMKIVKSLAVLDDSQRANILGSVLSHLGLSQTKGYMEAIRSKKY